MLIEILIKTYLWLSLRFFFSISNQAMDTKHNSLQPGFAKALAKRALGVQLVLRRHQRFFAQNPEYIVRAPYPNQPLSKRAWERSLYEWRRSVKDEQSKTDQLAISTIRSDKSLLKVDLARTIQDLGRDRMSQRSI
jgi:hypothetical protein